MTRYVTYSGALEYIRRVFFVWIKIIRVYKKSATHTLNA